MELTVIAATFYIDDYRVIFTPYKSGAPSWINYWDWLIARGDQQLDRRVGLYIPEGLNEKTAIFLLEHYLKQQP